MKHQILVVDDDTAVREGLCSVLELEGYEVIHAADGEEAVVRFRESFIDLVLLDFQMPQKQGLEAMAEILAINPLVPVVIITAAPLTGFPSRASGLCALVEKPVEIPVLLETISGLIQDSREARDSRLPATRPRALDRHSFRRRAALTDEVELASRMLGSGTLKRTESKLQALRRAWNQCGLQEQRRFMEEVAANACARDFFL